MPRVQKKECSGHGATPKCTGGEYEYIITQKTTSAYCYSELPEAPLLRKATRNCYPRLRAFIGFLWLPAAPSHYLIPPTRSYPRLPATSSGGP